MNELEQELKNGFSSFYNFSLSLIETLSEENGHLKFAVVNMQIALELFLKYYFIKHDLSSRVFNDKKGKRIYKDFSEVLDSYFKEVRQGHFTEKKFLKTILEKRNSIVHKGKFLGWDEDLANYIVSCALFIQGTLKNELGDTLITTTYQPHNLSKNSIWRGGAEKFAMKVAKDQDSIVMECPFCQSRTLVNKEVFNFNNYPSLEGLQCISCFMEIDSELNGRVVECPSCEEKSFFVDILNEQRDQSYLGGCFNCKHKERLRCCKNCEEYYFLDGIESEIFHNDHFFCSQNCVEMFNEMGSR
jgi:hypothetical protein